MTADSYRYILDSNKIEYYTDYSLKNCCTFKVGGFCRMAIFPDTEQKLIKCLTVITEAQDRLYVIGKGSNTLFADGYIDACLIFTEKLNAVKTEGSTVYADAGASLIPLCSRAADIGLGGLEFASGIPGSIGGALYMNAGAYGGCIGDVVKRSRAYDRESGEIITLTEHGFGYRKSVYSQNKNLTALSAELELTPANPDDIHKKMRELLCARREKQPLEYPSAGSYFKRPEGNFAGKLIDDCGLKGMAVGGACVSPKHAGFIVNTGGATFDDIMRLEELVCTRVYEKTGLLLEREVKIIK